MTGKSEAMCDQNNMQCWQGFNYSQAHMHIILQRCWMDSDSEHIFVLYALFVHLCLCTSPCEPIHGWQSRDSVFFHCASCSPQTLSIWSQVCRACWDPANQNISTLPQKHSTANQNISTLPLNNQQPIRTSTLSNSYLAAVQEGLISPSQYPSHHWYLLHTSTLSRGERQWQVWFNVRQNCY